MFVTYFGAGYVSVPFVLLIKFRREDLSFSLRTSHVRSAGSPFLVSLGLGEWGRDNMVSEQ